MRLILLAAVAALAACDALSPDPEVLVTHHATVRLSEDGSTPRVLGAALIRFEGGAVRGVEADNAEVLFRREGSGAVAAIVPHGAVEEISFRLRAVEGRGYGAAVVSQAADPFNRLYPDGMWAVIEEEVDDATE